MEKERERDSYVTLSTDLYHLLLVIQVLIYINVARAGRDL